MQAHPVMWFEVMGKNANNLQQFYAELFGWRINADNPMKYGMVDTGAKEGIQGGIGETDAGKARVTFYVKVNDPQAVLDRAVKSGGKVIQPVTELPEITIALFSDPEGNVIGVSKA